MRAPSGSPSGGEGWTARAYRPGDERQLVALFERVFQRSMTEAHWRWKHTGLPKPVASVWVAVSGDQVVFQYTGLPVRFCLPTREGLVMVGADAMTAPEWRRRGVFTGTTRLAYDAWRRAGVALHIGLPNEQWGSRQAAVGFQELFTLRWLVRPLYPERIVARRLRRPGIRRLTWPGTIWNRLADRRAAVDPTVSVRPVSRAQGEFDRLWQACRAEFAVSPIRDDAWVRWRYLEPPAFAYRVWLAERSGQPVGYAASRIDESAGWRVGAIADLFTAPSDAGARRTLIRRLVREFQSVDAEQAVTLAIPGSPAWRNFRTAGFAPRHPFSVQGMSFDPALPTSRLRDPARWSLVGGDFDVI